MSPNYRPRVSLYDALVGLTIEPFATVMRLLVDSNSSLPYKLLTILFLSFFLPFAIFVGLNPQYEGGSVIVGLLLSSAVVLVMFVILETVALKVLGINCSLEEVFAITSYGVTPLILFLWLVYGFNVGASGGLTIFKALLSKNAQYSDNFLQVIPYAFLLVQMNCALLLYYSIKKIGELHPISALFFVGLSIAIGYVSSATGLLVGEVASPGLMDAVITRLIPNSQSLGTLLSRLLSSF